MNTTYFMNCVAGNIFSTKTTPALPTKYYLGLSKTAPNVNGTGVTEPATDTGYSRIELNDLSEPDNGVVSNNNMINFEESLKSWGNITHFVIYDREPVGSGNLLMYGELSTPRSVEAETIMSIKDGYLKLSVQNPA